MTRPLRSTRITGLLSYHGAGPPLCHASVLSPSQLQPLGDLPSATSRGLDRHWPTASTRRQVPTFHTGAPTKLAPPPCRTPPGPSAGTRQAHPEALARPRFRCHLSRFDTSSAVHSRSPSWPTPDTLNGAPSPQRSAPRLLTSAPCGGLQPPPAGRPRRTTNPTTGQPLHLRCSTTSKKLDLLHHSSLQRSWSHSRTGFGSTRPNGPTETARSEIPTHNTA